MRLRFVRIAQYAVLASSLMTPLVVEANTDTLSGLDYFQRGAFAEAQEAWRNAAASGETQAALFLGVSYDVGAGVAQDEAEALSWYRLAASSGNTAAMFNLAVFYDTGRGVTRDPATAGSWYERAASAGYSRAEYNLGLMYEDGSLRPRRRAAPWFRRALRHGIAAAASHLAAFGEAPSPVGPRQTEEDPGLQAFQAAQAALLNRNPDEVRRAVDLFQQSAERNNALAAYDLGYCYENAIGVPEDLTQAYRWYRRSALTAGDDALRSLAGGSADRLARRLTPASLRQAQLQR